VANLTPLPWAAGNGIYQAVGFLLKKEETYSDQTEHHGRAPLFWAAIMGHVGVVKLLLKGKDINPGWPDSAGCRNGAWWNCQAAHGEKRSGSTCRTTMAVSNGDRRRQQNETPGVLATKTIAQLRVGKFTPFNDTLSN